MAKKAACKCKHVECEECPEWIFTFADLVMLMMGFFVILWVLKPSPSPKSGAEASNEDWVKVAASIREAFGYVPKAGSSDPVDVKMLMQRMKIPDGPGQGGRTNIKPDGATGLQKMVTAIRTGPQAVVGGKLIFKKADAGLTPSLTGTLDQIADQIRGHRNIVMVKGHTSLDDYDDSATPQQKMDLSIRRAQAVSDYLTANGVSPEILRVQGCSTFEPVEQGDYSPDAQTVNRRVEVEVTPTLVTALQSQKPGGNPTTQPGTQP
jgi:flagellar motor protein MotB